jgi:hypothetical protein
MHPRRALALWLTTTGWIYVGGGLVFVLLPDLLLGSINQTGALIAPGLAPIPLHPDGPERFWLVLSGAMMATIATCALLAARDIERRAILALPIVVSKLTSTVLGLSFFAASKAHLAYATIALTDLPLGIVTLWLYRRVAAVSGSSASGDIGRTASP